MSYIIKDKKILVTGGAGFIGYHLISELSKNNNEILVVDNLSTGNIKNIEKLKEKNKITFLKLDISKKTILSKLKNHKFDIIFNLACPANPDYCFSHPIDVIKTCVEGTFNIVQLARINNAKIIHTSTSEVYGDSLVFPQNETYFGNVNTIGDRACYEEGKRLAETILMESSKQYNIPIKIARIFNTYGPNMQLYDGRVIVNFIKNALKGDNLEIYGSGKQTRSFCYVTDLIQGLIQLENYNREKFLICNLGNPSEYSIEEVAHIVVKIIKTNSKIKYIPAKYDDHMKRKPDITKAKNLLNWEPKISFEEGLKKCIEYYSEEVFTNERKI